MTYDPDELRKRLLVTAPRQPLTPTMPGFAPGQQIMNFGLNPQEPQRSIRLPAGDANTAMLASLQPSKPKGMTGPGGSLPTSSTINAAPRTKGLLTQPQAPIATAPAPSGPVVASQPSASPLLQQWRANPHDPQAQADALEALGYDRPPTEPEAHKQWLIKAKAQLDRTAILDRAAELSQKVAATQPATQPTAPAIPTAPQGGIRMARSTVLDQGPPPRSEPTAPIIPVSPRYAQAERETPGNVWNVVDKFTPEQVNQARHDVEMDFARNADIPYSTAEIDNRLLKKLNAMDMARQEAAAPRPQGYAIVQGQKIPIEVYEAERRMRQENYLRDEADRTGQYVPVPGGKLGEMIAPSERLVDPLVPGNKIPERFLPPDLVAAKQAVLEANKKQDATGVAAGQEAVKGLEQSWHDSAATLSPLEQDHLKWYETGVEPPSYRLIEKPALPGSDVWMRRKDAERKALKQLQQQPENKGIPAVQLRDKARAMAGEQLLGTAQKAQQALMQFRGSLIRATRSKGTTPEAAMTLSNVGESRFPDEPIIAEVRQLKGYGIPDQTAVNIAFGIKPPPVRANGPKPTINAKEGVQYAQDHIFGKQTIGYEVKLNPATKMNQKVPTPAAWRPFPYNDPGFLKGEDTDQARQDSMAARIGEIREYLATRNVAPEEANKWIHAAILQGVSLDPGGRAQAKIHYESVAKKLGLPALPATVGEHTERTIISDRPKSARQEQAPEAIPQVQSGQAMQASAPAAQAPSPYVMPRGSASWSPPMEVTNPQAAPAPAITPPTPSPNITVDGALRQAAKEIPLNDPDRRRKVPLRAQQILNGG